MAIDLEASYVWAGDVVAGKYVVEHVLGTGGMAVVVAARHVELDEPFALKFLSRELCAQPEVVERFTREAKAACKIHSEHVARVYDVGVHDGAPFMVMEYLRGRDLATVLSEQGALPIPDAVDYAVQACEALAAVHSYGIVHRDVKPENLFVVERDGFATIKLLDFGISKVDLTWGSGRRLTGELAMGTPCYMAPEQIRSMTSADERSDLWSLGVVLYELLAGTEAFKGETVTELCAAVLEQDPAPLATVRPDVPRELAAVVERCLEKDPARRFADVAELAAAFLPFAPTRALVSAERSSSIMRRARHASGGGAATSSLPPASGPVEPSVADARERPAPRRRRALLAPAIALAALAAAGVVATRARAPAETDAAIVTAARSAEPALTPEQLPAVAFDAPKAPEAAVAVMTAVSKRPTPPAPTAKPQHKPAWHTAVAKKAAAPSASGTAAASATSAPRAAAASATAAAVELGY